MKRISILAAAISATALVACGGSDTTTTPPPDAGPTGFTQPAGTVAVNFTADDTANKVYVQGDLEWKGAMKYDPTTRKITADSAWAGPFAKLYDDGPWSAGGHEPAGATAGDHKWGITIFVTPPATGADTYAYGLNDGNACTTSSTVFGCNGWSWLGDNGSFAVPAGSTAPVNATGRTFPAFGTWDLQYTLDSKALISQCALTTGAACTDSLQTDGTCATGKVCCPTGQKCANSACVLKQVAACGGANPACPTGQSCATPDVTKGVSVKSSAWGWSEVTLTADATGKYTYQESASAGTGHVFPHAGLLNTNDTPEFVFNVPPGVEYRDNTQVGSPCALQGVSSQIKNGAGTFATAPVTVKANGNTTITIH